MTEGPDREALARRILIALTNVPDECAHERHGIPGCVHCDVDAVLALLPTPPAPGAVTEADYQGAEDPFADPPAPGDREGLRAEVERLRTYHVRVPEMNGTFLRRDDVIAALAARDTDQGARDALAEVRALHRQQGEFCEWDGFIWPCETIRALRAALARAGADATPASDRDTPEAEPGEHPFHSRPLRPDEDFR
jgi:hypothetical protein